MTKFDSLPAGPPLHSGAVTPLAPERMTFARAAERAVDGELEFSFRDFLARIAARKWLLVLCLAAPTLVGLAIAAMTPMTFAATTKILIRYSSSESVFLKGLIPDDRVSLSAAASSEILRSRPTIEAVVKAQAIEPSDLYLPTGKALLEVLGDLRSRIFGRDPPDDAETLNRTIARFQDSLQAVSALGRMNGRADAIEVLSNPSPVPQSVKGDELISLTVRAFNRAKVAGMANGLAQAFVDQADRLSAEDAERSARFLSLLADRLEADVARLEDEDGATPAQSGSETGAAGDGRMTRDSPAMTALAGQLAALEAGLARARQIYRDGAPELERRKAEIDRIRAAFAGRERLEIARQTLEQVRERRFQAMNAQRFYEARLEPISIVEPAVTPPPPTASAAILRYVSGGLTGLLIGAAVGLGAAVVLGAVDQRLFSAAEVERALALPVYGRVPRFAPDAPGDDRLASPSEDAVAAAEDGLSPAIGLIRGAGRRGVAGVVAIASAADGDGKSFVALMLAKAAAREGDLRVLLIDADPARASLTELFAPVGGRAPPPADAFRPEPVVRTDEANLDVLPRPPGPDMGVVPYSRWLRQSLDDARVRYDLVVVDAPSFLLAGRSLLCCKQADWVLIVVKRGASRKGDLKACLRRLHGLAVAPQGAILNFDGHA